MIFIVWEVAHISLDTSPGRVQYNSYTMSLMNSLKVRLKRWFFCVRYDHVHYSMVVLFTQTDYYIESSLTNLHLLGEGFSKYTGV